jgi:hypothetical protein
VYPADVQAKIDQARADAEARVAAAVAAAKAEDERIAALEAAKALCTSVCMPIGEAAGAATDPIERATLEEYGREKHAEHAQQLEQAYLAFSGQRAGESNPAPGGVTQIESHSSSGADTAADITS